MTHNTRSGMVAVALAVIMAGCATPTQTTYTPSKPAPPPAPTATANVREISRVTHDPAPEWLPRVSPDGTTLVFTVLDFTKQTWGEAKSIAAVTPGTAGRRLIAGPHAAEPAWFPDGKHLLYLYLKTQKPTLVRQPFGGVGMTFITPTAMGDADSQSHVSPKGDKIAFHTKIGESVNVCTVDADGSDFTVYVEGTSPRWHPSRNVLAFDRTVGQYSHLFLLDLGYGQVTQITTGESDNVFPVWSPDGAWICFVSDRDGKKHLYAMKADGSSLTQLTKGESQEYFPEWASDNTVYFTSDAGAPEAQSANPWKWRYADIWRLKPVLPE